MDTFNHGPADLVAILPLTTRDRGIPLHVPIQPPEGGLKEISYILCDMVRTIARERLLEPWGKISIMTMNSVEDRVRILLGL